MPPDQREASCAQPALREGKLTLMRPAPRGVFTSYCENHRGVYLTQCDKRPSARSSVIPFTFKLLPQLKPRAHGQSQVLPRCGARAGPQFGPQSGPQSGDGEASSKRRAKACSFRSVIFCALACRRLAESTPSGEEEKDRGALRAGQCARDSRRLARSLGDLCWHEYESASGIGIQHKHFTATGNWRERIRGAQTTLSKS